jgi:hypothetical protein
MGAVFVLERLPKSQEEILAALKKDRARFAEGLGMPGVRLGNELYIQETHKGGGTEYHEATHRLSQRAVRDVLGFHFNEGVTEYFARLVVKGPVSRNELVHNEAQYLSQYGGIVELLRSKAATEDELADAYFKGMLQPLFARFADRTKQQMSLQAYADHLDPNHSFAAQEVLDTKVQST